MQSAGVVQEKLPMWYNYQQQQQEDGFMMWLRSEFAAANAMIDALCHHLRAVSTDPSEYDGVIRCVQQRRCNWSPVLQMQQYFSVNDVVYQLQQLAWKRQMKAVERTGNGTELRRGGKKVTESDKKSEVISSTIKQATPQPAVMLSEGKPDVADSCKVDGIGKLQKKQNVEVTPRTFVATEICDGKPVNVAEGLKLYEDLFDESQVSKLVNSVNDLRAAGKKGQLQGQSFIISKKPMKGHGREMIQLGVPIADAPPENEVTPGTFKELKAEPIPASWQDVIERLLTENVVSTKPDSCIIDIFNEGDHSPPHFWPQWFGRPVCVLFLTECEMSFGKVMAVDHPKNFRGALELSLSPGSMLVMQGKSSDFVRHAISSLQKQRILVTFVKSQPKKTTANSDSQRSPSNWVPPPSRSPSHARPMATKHFVPGQPTGILPHQRLPPPNAIQPIFVTTPVTPPALAAIPPTSVGWTAPHPRHPVPGTGVFLPSQNSINSPDQTKLPIVTENITTVTSEKSDSLAKSNVAQDGGVPEKESNEGIDGKTGNAKEEVHENLEAVKSGGEVLGKDKKK